MSKSSLRGNCRHVNVKVIDCVDKNPEGLNPELIQNLIPDFKKYVQFALIEVLELDRKKSSAKTWVYCEEDKKEDVNEIVEEYFNVVKALFKEKSFLLSTAAPFYFDEFIYCSQLINPSEYTAKSSDCQWFGTNAVELKEIDLQVHSITPDELMSTYEEYLEVVGQSLLKPYPASYVLLVPVALNHSEHDHQRPIGAVFIHLGLSQALNDDQAKALAQDVFRGINLYWHYNLTSESLKKQFDDAKKSEAQAAAEKFAGDLYKDEVVPKLKELAKAVFDLEVVADPDHVQRAAKTLNMVSKILSKCFPPSGDVRGGEHNPYGHENLDALYKKLESDVNIWVDKFISYAAMTDAYEKSGSTDKLQELFKPFKGLSLFNANDPRNPHPALCLAKCISSNRIPLAWILQTLECSYSEEDWRMFSRIENSEISIFKVLHPLRICAVKLQARFSSIDRASDGITIKLQPNWEKNYSLFYNSVKEGLSQENPAGGTAKVLAELRRLGFDVYLQSLDNGDGSDGTSFSRPDKTAYLGCIHLSANEACFIWPIHPELTKESDSRNREEEL